MNALAATAAALAAGAELADIRAGLESLAPVAGRFNIHRLAGGVTVIDDTYNANPESLQAALEVLAMAGGETWLVLGDMGELGGGAQALHREAGRMAGRAGVDRLFTLGPLAQQAAESFTGPVTVCEDLSSLLVALRRERRGAVHILVKGSRRMHMERVVEALGAPVRETRVETESDR
jgi:UDP-N-acetylmuramoyl-tripeptide--D-alanyl-D-alanine ligase